jgi:glutathione S-transferase
MSESHSEKSQLTKKTKKRSSARRTHPGTEPQLELFQRENDPACHAVRNRLSQLGLDYLLRNVRLGDALKNEQLAQAGGKIEVPLLIDHLTGIKLYGAHSIITYLDHEYGQATRSPVLRVAGQINSKVQQNADQLTWAVRAPLEQIQKIGGDTREAVKILSQSMTTLRQVWSKKKAG